MTPEEHERVEQLFGAALEFSGPQWEAFLAEVCANEPAFRKAEGPADRHCSSPSPSTEARLLVPQAQAP
jgi:hypothetical protein